MTKYILYLRRTLDIIFYLHITSHAMKSDASLAFFAALIALAIPRHVEAHGFVSGVEILGSTKFTGPKPGSTKTNNSPIRAITDQSPVKDMQSKDMICGFGATPGTVVASAKPGDSLVYTVSYLFPHILYECSDVVYIVGEHCLR